MKSKSNAEQEKRKKQGRQERIRADRGMLSRTGVILILCGIVAFLPVVGMLTNLMEHGKLGFKSGEGFQPWSEERIKESNENLTRGLITVTRALGRL